MGGIPFEKQMDWRTKIEVSVKLEYDGDNRIKFIHPPLFFNYENHNHKTEKEIFEWEMKQLHDSDIVIVNFDGIDSTIGSHMELGAVQGINRFGDRYIYVVGLGEENDLHPWIKESCIRIEKSYSDLARYIIDYLLV